MKKFYYIFTIKTEPEPPATFKSDLVSLPKKIQQVNKLNPQKAVIKAFFIVIPTC